MPSVHSTARNNKKDTASFTAIANGKRSPAKKQARSKHKKNDPTNLLVRPTAKRVRGVGIKDGMVAAMEAVVASISPTTVNSNGSSSPVAGGFGDLFVTTTTINEDEGKVLAPAKGAGAEAPEGNIPNGTSKEEQDAVEQVVQDLYRLFDTADPKDLVASVQYLQANAEHIKAHIPLIMKQHQDLHQQIADSKDAYKQLEVRNAALCMDNHNLRLQVQTLHQQQAANNKNNTELAENFAVWISQFCYNITQQSSGLTSYLVGELHHFIVKGVVGCLSDFGREHASLLNGESRPASSTGSVLPFPSAGVNPASRGSMSMVEGVSPVAGDPAFRRRPSSMNSSSSAAAVPKMKNYNKPRSNGKAV